MKNEYEVRGDVIAISLTKRDGTMREALVDATDFDTVASMPNTWLLQSFDKDICYARNARGLAMHRVVTGAQRGYVVDHINHNGLDNRRKNLRVVSQSENMLNRGGLDANKSSGFRGVFWDATKHNFIAIVEVRGKRHRLGRFIVAHEGAFAVRDFLAQVDPVAAENYPPIEIPRFVCARSGHAR
jgi:hypothetical protein